MKESDIRRIIATTSARLDRAAARAGNGGGPVVVTALVLGAGLVASACVEAQPLYGVECIGDECNPGGTTTAVGGGGAGGEGGSQGGASSSGGGSGGAGGGAGGGN